MTMGSPLGIDPDLLRAFAFIAEEGSFTRAAERTGRTQSAVSMQVQRLEALLGQRVLQRGRGGSVQLTSHGQYLLERSRDLLALNDEIWTNFHQPSVQGTVRLGTPDDYALRYLPQVLKRFADTHPAVEVAVTCAPSSELIAKLKAGEIDLALCSEGHEPRHWPATELWRGPLRWITSDRYAPHRLDPLPLAVAAADCPWRVMTLAALEKAGRRYRIAYTAATNAGTHAPVMAGLAVTTSPITWLPEGLRTLSAGELLPELPNTAILLLTGQEPSSGAVQTLATHITDTFRHELRMGPKAGMGQA